MTTIAREVATMSGVDSVAAQVAACPLRATARRRSSSPASGCTATSAPSVRSTASTSCCAPARSRRCSGPAAAARRRSCACSRASSARTPGRSRSAAPSSPAAAGSRRPSAGGSAWSSRTTRCSRTSTSPRTSATRSGAGPTASASPRSSTSSASRGLGDRRPDELSGGQQQRVALARALAPTPQMILLDEPFSNLDAALRDRVRTEVRDILRAAGVTTLLVTHDQEEALSLADTVSVMRDGRVEQTGRPEEVYGSPATRWVGEFLGEIDVLPGEAADGAATCALGRVPVPRGADRPGRGARAPGVAEPRHPPRPRRARGRGRRPHASTATTSSSRSS